MELKRSVSLFAVLFLVLGLALVPGGAGASDAYVEPALQAALASAGSADQIVAIANFDPTVTDGAALAAAVQDLGAGTIGFQTLDAVGVVGTAAQIGAVAGLPGLTGLYANKQLRFYLHESVPAIGADRAWTDFGATGRGIGAAVIDSGIDASHPDLAFGSKTVQNVKVVANVADVVTYKGQKPKPIWVENVVDTDTTMGHGTHVAGTIAGSGAASGGYYTGVAKEANLVGIGTGETLFIIWALAGFDYAVSHASQYGIKVISNSWGTTHKAADYDPKDPINRASKKAHDRGITVVFAAGNDGDSCDAGKDCVDTMNHYAMAPWVIGVAAGCKPQADDPTNSRTHCTDGGLLADFSSRGVPGSQQFHPTLTAPGVHVVSARASTGTVMSALDANHDATICAISAPNAPRYTCASGTSMATPHVSGTVALMQQAAGGKLSPDQIKNTLVQTATPMFRTVNGQPGPYGLYQVGAGYLDAYAAVKAVRR